MVKAQEGQVAPFTSKTPTMSGEALPVFLMCTM
jgi:hypothetical protein